MHPQQVAYLDDRTSLRALMAAWEGICKEVCAACEPKLGYYLWQPTALPADQPFLTNWLGRSPYQILDTGRARDSIQLFTRIINAPGEEATTNDRWVGAADTFRGIVDPLLWTPRNTNPLRGTAYRASRQDMYMESIEVGNVVMGRSITFTMQFDVDRKLRQEA
jgi:hypothetical protein